MARIKEHTPIFMGMLHVVHPSTIPLARTGAFQWGKPVKQEADWAGPLPKGWTDKSRSKFYDSMSHEEGPTKTCMKKIDGHVDDPGAFCGSLRDQATGTTKWRHGGGKKK